MDLFSPQDGFGIQDSGIEERLALLDTLFASGQLGFGFVDRRFRFTRVNPRLAAINGIPAEAHLGRSVEEVLGAALWESRLPLFERALAGEEVVDVALAGRTPDPAHGDLLRGERRVLSSYYPVLQDAEVMGVAVVVRDVTDQKRAEEALRASREQYRLIFEANPQPMWVYDLETLAFLAVNAAAVRVYGYSADEFLAMTLADIRPAEDAPALTASVGAPRVGTRTDGPWRHLRKDRSVLWVEIAASALDFQGRAARLITALDVTERIEMEGERRQVAERRQAFMRDVLASVTEGKLLLSDPATPLPAPLAPVGGPIPLTREGGLWELRRRAQGAAQESGYSDLRQFDLITAASEAGMNAIVHAGGGTTRVFAGKTGTDESGRVQVWVEDQGAGIAVENLPRAALARGFTTAGSLGHGLKMMLETADHLYLRTGPEGTTALIEQEREPPLPSWLSEALR